jgi:hypothetical protein
MKMSLNNHLKPTNQTGEAYLQVDIKKLKEPYFAALRARVLNSTKRLYKIYVIYINIPNNCEHKKNNCSKCVYSCMSQRGYIILYSMLQCSGSLAIRQQIRNGSLTYAKKSDKRNSENVN